MSEMSMDTTDIKPFGLRVQYEASEHHDELSSAEPNHCYIDTIPDLTISTVEDSRSRQGTAVVNKDDGPTHIVKPRLPFQTFGFKESIANNPVKTFMEQWGGYAVSCCFCVLCILTPYAIAMFIIFIKPSS